MPSRLEVLVNLLRKHDLGHLGEGDNIPNNTERRPIFRSTALVINPILSSRTSSNTAGSAAIAAVSISPKPTYAEAAYQWGRTITRHVQFRRKRQRWRQEMTVAIRASCSSDQLRGGYPENLDRVEAVEQGAAQWSLEDFENMCFT